MASAISLDVSAGPFGGLVELFPQLNEDVFLRVIMCRRQVFVRGFPLAYARTPYFISIFALRYVIYRIKRNMKKYILDLRVVEVRHINERYVLLRLTDPNGSLPEMKPGQFVQVRVDNSPSTYLRRPISIHNVDRETNELWLLVRLAGEGTRHLALLEAGETLNLVLPLGNGFTMPAKADEHPLLVGGGVGVAPLLYAGIRMREMGVEPTFLLGARSKDDLLQMDEFRRVGRVFVTTEDGSEGERGFVTQHSLLASEQFTRISVCGPKPMMVAVARFARQAQVACEVSLENMMACGLGACLCCVEDTDEGHVCVCKEGPVFDIEKLKWQI